jgi:hypothetical protein
MKCRDAPGIFAHEPVTAADGYSRPQRSGTRSRRASRDLSGGQSIGRARSSRGKNAFRNRPPGEPGFARPAGFWNDAYLPSLVAENFFEISRARLDNLPGPDLQPFLGSPFFLPDAPPWSLMDPGPRGGSCLPVARRRIFQRFRLCQAFQACLSRWGCRDFLKNSLPPPPICDIIITLLVVGVAFDPFC